MFCSGCGKEVSETDAFCRSCGRSLLGNEPVSTESVSGNAVATEAEKPGEPPRRSGEATASLVLGLFSFIPIVGLLAVIFGHMAKGSIRRSGGRLLGEGMAGVGLVFGYLGLAGWAVYGLTLLVHPFLPSTQRAENREMAISELRTINVANVTYSSIYNHGYASTLSALGEPKGLRADATASEMVKAESAEAAGLIDDVLASGTKDEYRFSYVSGPKVKGMVETYTVHADPVTPDETLHYFIDESGVIRFEMNEPADANSLAVGE